MQASSANGPPEIQAGKPQPRPLSTRSVEAATRALLAFHEANEEQGATIVELRLVKDLRRSSEALASAGLHQRTLLHWCRISWSDGTDGQKSWNKCQGGLVQVQRPQRSRQDVGRVRQVLHDLEPQVQLGKAQQ